MLLLLLLLAKIGADAAENEQHFAEILPIGRCVAGVGLTASASYLRNDGGQVRNADAGGVRAGAEEA